MKTTLLVTVETSEGDSEQVRRLVGKSLEHVIDTGLYHEISDFNEFTIYEILHYDPNDHPPVVY
jgi:hypothetical protein